MSGTEIGAFILMLAIFGTALFVFFSLLTFLWTGKSIFWRLRAAWRDQQSGDADFQELCRIYEQYALREFVKQRTFDEVERQLMTKELLPVADAPDAETYDFLDYVRAHPHPKFQLYLNPIEYDPDSWRLHVTSCTYGYMGKKLIRLVNTGSFHHLIVDCCVWHHDFEPIRQLILKLDEKHIPVEIPREKLTKEYNKGPLRRMYEAS